MHSEPIVIFLHLPKTAGSTLAHILERQYGANAVVAQYEHTDGYVLASLAECQDVETRAIVGHLSFGAHVFVDRPTTYITILRDPVDRVISHYYFVRGDPSHYLFPMAQEFGLAQFVAACGGAEPNNDQTRLLAGSEEALRTGICSADLLPIAKRNLEQHFAVVGLSEEFDRSVILMKRVLGWRMPWYTSQNVSRRRPRSETLSAETVHLIEQHNLFDIDLYHHAREMFRKQAKQQGTSYEHEVRRFRRLNASYGRMMVVRSDMAGRRRSSD